MVHADIKPRNIVRDGANDFMLIDLDMSFSWGLTHLERAYSADHPNTSTATTTVKKASSWAGGNMEDAPVSVKSAGKDSKKKKGKGADSKRKMSKGALMFAVSLTHIPTRQSSTTVGFCSS